jgi:hypothetical protein
MNNLPSITIIHGGPCLVNAVVRRLNGGGSWVGRGPCLVNAVARRLSGGGSWVGVGPCLLNVVARRLNGGGSWVGELVGVADVMKG